MSLLINAISASMELHIIRDVSVFCKNFPSFQPSAPFRLAKGFLAMYRRGQLSYLPRHNTRPNTFPRPPPTPVIRHLVLELGHVSPFPESAQNPFRLVQNLRTKGGGPRTFTEARCLCFEGLAIPGRKHDTKVASIHERLRLYRVSTYWP
jgi:hypothetical protein